MEFKIFLKEMKWTMLGSARKIMETISVTSLFITTADSNHCNLLGEITAA